MALADKSHPFGWLIDSLAAGGHAPPGSKPKRIETETGATT
jgi:hypothetical protein